MPDGLGSFSPLFTWRSAVASGHGPRDFELAVVRDNVTTTTTVKGPTQRHVALSLSLHMNEKGSSCFPGVKRIARESGLGERTVQRAVRALEQAGWLSVDLNVSGQGTNLYAATIPSDYVPDEGEGGRTGYGGGPSPVREGGVPGTPKDDNEDDRKDDKNESPSGHDLVCEAWRRSSPPLIAHRDAYFKTDRCKTATRRALDVYPAEAVVAAVENFAVVLGGDAYRWTYQWTLIDFLGRGLDRFVPEADPLANYSVRRGGEPQRRALDGIDIL